MTSRLPWLGPDDPLPPPETAYKRPNGLLAAGGGLSRRRLLDAYRHGAFPWFNPGEPVLWWHPDPRTVLATDAVHVSRTLARRLRRSDYQVTIDAAFGQVIRACAAPRRDGPDTWLSPEMTAAYEDLHAAGHARSLEVWRHGVLAGGIYGVAIGRAFYGESMFSRETDGSKIAITWLAAQLARWGVPFIDCQLPNEHLLSLGARSMPRAAFVRVLGALTAAPPCPWRLDDDLTGAAVAAAFRPASSPTG